MKSPDDVDFFDIISYVSKTYSCPSTELDVTGAASSRYPEENHPRIPFYTKKMDPRVPVVQIVPYNAIKTHVSIKSSRPTVILIISILSISVNLKEIATINFPEKFEIDFQRNVH